MDSYRGGNSQDKEKGKDGPGKDPAAKPPQRRGTGNLSADTFQSGTGQLNARMGTTKRLSTGPLDVERTVGAMATEIENGKIIVSKLEGRIAVLTRAMRIIERPADVNQLCAGISQGEANFTKQVAKVLQADPAITRRVQVALYQFDQARKGLQQAEEVMQRAEQYTGAAKAQFVEAQLHVEKLRGQLYPLINLHVVFKDNPLISQLIPTPKAAPVEDLPPPPPPPPVEEAKSPSGTLASSALANDPAVREVVEAFNRVTGNLKDRVTGLLGLRAGAKAEEKK